MLLLNIWFLRTLITESISFDTRFHVSRALPYLPLCIHHDPTPREPFNRELRYNVSCARKTHCSRYIHYRFAVRFRCCNEFLGVLASALKVAAVS